MDKPPRNDQEQGTGLLWGGFLLGAMLGTLGGLLFAPRSGQETRAQLRSALEELSQLTENLTFDVQSQAERLSDQALQQWEDTLSRLREAITAGIEASQAEARSQRYTYGNRNTITVPAESSNGDRLTPDSPVSERGQEAG